MVAMKKSWMIGALLVASIAGAAPSYAAGEPATTGGPATFRRLNQAQYTQAIADVFGTGLKIPGRFEPPLREDGLLAIGDGKVAVSPAGFEQDELRGREIAAQVLSDDRRKNLMTCAPPSPEVFDETCASAFIAKYGRL